MSIPIDQQLSSYDFDYPPELIADQPAATRDSSRLLVLEKGSGKISHRQFRDLPEFLRKGDCLVLNHTKVWPARLIGKKSTGGKAELLLVREIEPGLWAALASGFKPGMRVNLKDEVHFTVESLSDTGEYICRFSTKDVLGLMTRQGLAPLPPYILKTRKNAPAADSSRVPRPDQPGGNASPIFAQAQDPKKDGISPDDLSRYQTVYAKEEGSIAAPTAGLHFTPELLDQLKQAGVRIAEVLLHVGRGTFRPITAENVNEHEMLPEWYRVGSDTLATIESARREGRRIVAVGTTATRTLETLARRQAPEGWTDLYIHPGHEFKLVDALITNFHLPRSSPLILASAFAGRKRLLAVYREAIGLGYRLYSYGDAMLVL